MSVLNCLIVEDETLAARVVADYIEQVPGLSLKGICEDVFSASEKLRAEKIDILFLDINLPRVNGIDFIKTITGKYHIILTTAYYQYAIEAFDMDVVDYLLKPISFERFLKAVNKVRDYQELLDKTKEQNLAALSYFFVKTGNGLEKVSFDAILFIEALQNYIVIHTKEEKLITYSTLKNVEAFLPSARFLKVQKSYVVSIDKIERIDGNQIIVGKTPIMISRANKDEILHSILANNILKR
jgi:DNA-binding LytR/AlgR family response regulator